MMRGLFRFIALCVAGFGFAALSGTPAYAQKNLVVDLASNHVDITTGFNGANLMLFGVKDRVGDVAVVIRGPRKDMTVRKKNRIAGIWMNTQYMDFDDVPEFYDFAISKKIGFDTQEQLMLRENGVGLSTLVFEPKDAVPDRERVSQFQEALIRTKQMQGMFPVKGKSIEFLSDTFFRATLYLPANVPTGDYVIETLLFRGDRLVDRNTTRLTVAQVGLNAQVYDWAMNRSFYYGLFCVVFAAFSGWIINVIRNK